MCTQCDPYRPGNEDNRSITVEDAARWERDRAEAQGWPYDDRPTLAELGPEDLL